MIGPVHWPGRAARISIACSLVIYLLKLMREKKRKSVVENRPARLSK